MMPWSFGRKPNQDDIERARRRLEAVEAQYRYVLDSPEAREAIGRAREELAEIEAAVEAEQRRVEAVKASKEKERKEKEAAQRKATEGARKKLPTLAEEAERAAQEYWTSLVEVVTKAVRDIEAVEGLADRLDDARRRLEATIREAGEANHEGGVTRPTPALQELLKVARKKSGAKVEVPSSEDLNRLGWVVSEARAIGQRNSEFGLPAGGPCLETAKARREDAARQHQEALRAIEKSREEARRKREAAQAELQAEVEKRRPAMEKLLRERYGPYTHELRERARDLVLEEIEREKAERKGGGKE